MNSANEQKPRLLVIADPNGAGKTTVTERGLAHEWFAGCQYINPDFIARDELGDWNSPDAILKAAQLASQLQEDYLANGQSMAFETVFSAPDKVEFLYRAHQQGYFIRVFFIATADPNGWRQFSKPWKQHRNDYGRQLNTDFSKNGFTEF